MQQNVNKEHTLQAYTAQQDLEGDIYDKNRIQGQQEGAWEGTNLNQAFLQG